MYVYGDLANIHIYICTCNCIYIYILYTCRHVEIYIYTYIYIFLHMHVYIYTYQYTHRLLCSSFLVMTYIFFLGIILDYPKKELHASLWVYYRIYDA